MGQAFLKACGIFKGRALKQGVGQSPTRRVSDDRRCTQKAEGANVITQITAVRTYLMQRRKKAVLLYSQERAERFSVRRGRIVLSHGIAKQFFAAGRNALALLAVPDTAIPSLCRRCNYIDRTKQQTGDQPSLPSDSLCSAGLSLTRQTRLCLELRKGLCPLTPLRALP